MDVPRSVATAWVQTGSGPAHLRLTTDGNLQVISDRSNQALWSSSTAPNPGHPYPVNLELQTDRNLALHRTNGQYMWDAEAAPVCP